MLAEDPLHLPWTALYLIDGEHARAWMAASVGVLDEGVLLPASVDISNHAEQSSLGQSEPSADDVKVNAEAGFAHVIRTRRPLALTLEHVGVGGVGGWRHAAGPRRGE